ncbi:MAG: primosomal protein N' [Syntrophotaleaceae bacterium]
MAHVAVAAPLDKPLSYLVPDPLRDRVRTGVRLRVPLGRRLVVGFLLRLEMTEVAELKPICEVLDEEPLFGSTMVPFLERAAEYYCHPLGEVFRTALPAGLANERQRVAIATERFLYLREPEVEVVGRKQQAILNHLRERKTLSMEELGQLVDNPGQSLHRLIDKGVVGENFLEKRRDPFAGEAPEPDKAVVPGPEQSAALAAIGQSLQSGQFTQILLHGVTGSGKTEVYLRAIEQAIAGGKQALVLVPEIGLTPQLVGRFRARFADRVRRLAVLHSGLSDGERYDAWRAVARGDVDIIVGARSAVFAPASRLGIIVVDEEHETSYKQGEGFRYNARDLALLRGQMEGATVLLGSATPALTTFFRARQGQISYQGLPCRILDRPLPEVKLIDLRQERPEGSLSETLRQSLLENLERREQSLLLLNRRGFAPYLLCMECGATLRCPNCEITLTYYQKQRRLRCNYCDFSQSPPDVCPACLGSGMTPEGAGTERLEEELANLFPGARVGRMDRDTTGRKGAHQRLVKSMACGEIDILVGTQMVAKGHDFPGVTLVGVVNADSALNLPDFRAAERSFTLLTQVAGRAGRGEKPGKVLIQTFVPEHYVLEAAARHDYAGFYEQETAIRRELSYPPFGYLTNCVLAGNDLVQVAETAAVFADELERLKGNLAVEILGPAPCPLNRLRGKWRFQILLKAVERSSMRRILSNIGSLRARVPRRVSLIVDVDPLDML